MRGILNFLILQWFFIRLAEVVQRDTETGGLPEYRKNVVVEGSAVKYHAMIYFVWPLTGWFG